MKEKNIPLDRENDKRENTYIYMKKNRKENVNRYREDNTYTIIVMIDLYELHLDKM